MLFGFVRHSLPDNILEGYVDIHSHILPGVDDGFPSVEKSVSALRYFSDKGVSAIVLTPHFMNEYPNTRESISARYETFRANVGDLPLKLFLAGEYMLDSGFEKHEKDGVLTLGTSKKVLCETSYIMCEPMAGQMLYNAALDGYEIVIAHPERYVYASKADYERWKSFGYKLQLNMLSFSGAYGAMAANKALSLLDDGMYDFVGTDIHSLGNFSHFFKHIKLKSKQIDKIKTLMENNASLVS